MRDKETDKLRNKGRSLRFLYKSKRATLKEEAVQVCGCGWKRRDTLQACQHPINKRRRRCHKHSQVLGKVTDRCPYCAEISLESSFKRVHLTHCHHMNGVKNLDLSRSGNWRSCLGRMKRERRRDSSQSLLIMLVTD